MADATPPEPLDLADVKLNLRVSSAAEDQLITGLIVDAREFVEKETGLVLVPRTITETAAHFGRWIELASWPVSAVTEIRYPLAGVMTPLAPGSWVESLKRRPVRLLPVSVGWGVASVDALAGVTTLPIEIDVEAGYATAGDIPRAATRAMHLLIAHWYANRASAEVGARAAAIEVPFGVTALCDQLKLTRV